MWSPLERPPLAVLGLFCPRAGRLPFGLLLTPPPRERLTEGAALPVSLLGNCGARSCRRPCGLPSRSGPECTPASRWTWPVMGAPL